LARGIKNDLANFSIPTTAALSDGGDLHFISPIDDTKRTNAGGLLLQSTSAFQAFAAAVECKRCAFSHAGQRSGGGRWR
jgi:hypothetical protein